MTRRKRIGKIFLDYKNLDKPILEGQGLFFRNIRKYFDTHGNLTNRQIETAEQMISENQRFNKRWKEDTDHVLGNIWNDPDPINNSDWGGPDSETDQDEVY